MLDAALAHADRVVVTSDDPRHEDPQAIIDDVLAGRNPHRVEPDRRTAIHEAVAAMGPATCSSSWARATSETRSSVMPDLSSPTSTRPERRWPGDDRWPAGGAVAAV